MGRLVAIAAENLASCRIMRPLLRELYDELDYVIMVPNLPASTSRDRDRFRRLVTKASFGFLAFKAAEIHVHHALSWPLGRTIHQEAAAMASRCATTRRSRTRSCSPTCVPRRPSTSSAPAPRSSAPTSSRSPATLNCHCARLPEYRGAANYVWMLNQGETHAYASIQEMELALDEGPLLAERALRIAPHWSAYRLNHELSGFAGELYAEVARRVLDSGLPAPVERPGAVRQPRLPAARGSRRIAAQGPAAAARQRRPDVHLSARERLIALAPPALLALTVTAFYLDALFGAVTIQAIAADRAGDALGFFRPHTIDQLRVVHAFGSLASWNDRVGLGAPAIGQLGTYYPPRLAALAVASSPGTATDVLVWGHALLAALATYALLRVYGIGRWPAVLGGQLYALSHLAVRWAPISHAPAYFAALPLGVLGVELIWRRRGWLGVPLLALSVAIAILGGRLQNAHLLVQLLAVIVLFRLVTDAVGWRARLRPLGASVAGLALGALTASPALVASSPSSRPRRARRPTSGASSA